nr:universal stress protein [Hymenolepis microstoma]
MSQAKSVDPKVKSNVELGRRVLFPVDKSLNARGAFEWFFKFGYRQNDFIIFANIIHPRYTRGIINLESTSFNPSEDFQLNFDEAHKIEDEYKELAKNVGVNFSTTFIADTDVVDAINMLADQEKANLIITTALGESIYDLIGDAKIPVLIVPSEEMDKQNS